MPTFDRKDPATGRAITIHYEEQGSGHPVLALAPGGLNSAGALWDRAPWNPVTQLADEFRVIAMDQRNAGASSGPITGGDGWHSYAEDQLALLDHLGVDRFSVIGMCIGGAFILKLIETAPQRVAAAVALQPIGLEDNRQVFHDLFDTWAAERRQDHPETSEEDWAAFRESLYGGDNTLWSVPDEAIPQFTTPLLVCMGADQYHPSSASRRLAELAPNATLIERWKDEECVPDARKAAREFLLGNR